MRKISHWLELISHFFAQRKGLLPMLGIVLVIVNFGLQFTGDSWLSRSDFMLHAGVIIAIIGIMLTWAL